MVVTVESFEGKIESLQDYKNAYNLKVGPQKDSGFFELLIYEDYSKKYNCGKLIRSPILIKYLPLARCIDDMLTQITHLRSACMKYFMAYNAQKEAVETLKAALQKEKESHNSSMANAFKKAVIVKTVKKEIAIDYDTLQDIILAKLDNHNYYGSRLKLENIVQDIMRSIENKVS